MSTLRIIGILFGIVSCGISFYRLRTFSEKRTDIWIFFLFGFSLILISLFPGIVNLPADMISLGDQKGGRLTTLLLISNALLWFLYLYERNKNTNRNLKFDGWVRNTTVNEFLKNHRQLSLHDSILVLIPAYNEAKNLVHILPQIPQKINNHPVTVLVIDDGSLDDTAVVSRKYGALVASHQTNRGGGAALKVGYEIIKKISPSVIVTMDADGQHNPGEIEIIVAPILNDKSDFVIGSRIIGSYDQDSRLRFYGVNIFSKMINVMLGIHITDCSSGFRAFNKEILDNCLLMQEQYHTAELIIEAAKRGYRIQEQPVHIAKRLSGTSKKGKNFKYALFFFRTIVKSWLR